MGETPEELRHEIALQREAISTDLDAIGDRVSPGRVVERKQAEYRWRTRQSLRRAQYRVMGDPNATRRPAGSRPATAGGDSSGGLKNAATGVMSTVSDTTSGAAEAVGNIPGAVTRQTQGSPFAVGLVSFGVGLLIAALLPETEPEQQLAAQVQPQLENAIAQARDSAQGVAADLREPAQQAVEAVKTKATESAQAVKDDAVDHAQTAKDDITTAATD